ncbi:VOC family protein [Fretibacter rubidus]|uniref:VOC family protein n=1 Tax=Fretibacter rubidus TaxID=570162 RepID=UPI00352B63BB
MTVANIAASRALYCDWLDYRCVEEGVITKDLAQSWDAPKTAGCRYVLLQPASNREIYIRLIEQAAVPSYKPLRSYGWAAIEICNQDTLTVNERMERSPFKIIGPPKELDGLPAIFPMQVQGPDDEIVYLTEIRDDLAEYDLPRAQSLIDSLFILVLACSDMEATGAWMQKHLLIEKGRSIELIYSMINNAFNLPADTKHTIATLKHERDVFLEIDQYPDGTITRPTHDGMLPPCAAIASFHHPDFEAVMAANDGLWITPPTRRDGIMYKSKRVGTLRDPDGTLIEMIEA